MATIGTDPELFVGIDNNIRAVCGKLGGTKGKPIDLGRGIGLQEDNVMLEYNIPATDSPAEFADYVRDGLETVLAYARDRMGPDITPIRTGEILVPGDQLEHPLALTFGCSQDFDSHNRGQAAAAVNPRTLEENTGAWRFAGGHVHMGYENPHNVPPFVVASLADVFLGLPSIRDGDVQEKRRALYGQPGRYRPTPYGIEYRVLSNYWIWDYGYAYEVGMRAHNLARAIEEQDLPTIQRWYKETPWADVRQAINTNDAQMARDLDQYLQRDIIG